MGTDSPDVWARTAEISFGSTEVTRHEFYECFEPPDGTDVSVFDAVARLPSRTVCVFRIGFKSTAGHYDFLAKYRNIKTVMIGDREVEIKVRDRTMNLIRVRVQHFKFNDDLSKLASRLGEYGSVSRIDWDTYKDQSLPKWQGIKTGVINVDMEVHKNIPSYIIFGNYKHQLMVSYDGQLPTCRLCESTTHVLVDCPKVAKRVAPQSTIPQAPIAARTYRNVVAKPVQPKPTASGGGVQVNKQPAPPPDLGTENFPELGKKVARKDSTTEVPRSTPENSKNSSDDEADDTSSESSTSTSKPPKKKKTTESREFRDQQKQFKKKGFGVHPNVAVEVTNMDVSEVAQTTEGPDEVREVQGSDLPTSNIMHSRFPVFRGNKILANKPNEGEEPLLDGVNNVPPKECSPEPETESTTIDQVDSDLDAIEVDPGSIPDEDISFSSASIRPGQKPPDSQTSHVSDSQQSLGIDLGTPSPNIKDQTMKALEAMHKKKMQESQKPRPHGKSQSTKPNFRF